MARTEAEYLLQLWHNNICPYCGKKIPEGTRVGSGRKSEGGFCSLDCYARYYQTELEERTRGLAKVVSEPSAQPTGGKKNERNTG